MNTKTAVVYEILNCANGKRYVGSTQQRPKARWNMHRSLLRRGQHHSYRLQSAWNSFGEAAFAFKVLLVCAQNDVLDYETRLLPLANYNVQQNPCNRGVEGRWAGHVKKQKPPIVPWGMLRSQEWKDPAVRLRRIEGMRKSMARPEVRAKRVVISTGRVMPRAAIERAARAKWRPVYCPEIGCSFLSQKHAAEYFGVVPPAISNALSQGCRIAGKFSLVRV